MTDATTKVKAMTPSERLRLADEWQINVCHTTTNAQRSFGEIGEDMANQLRADDATIFELVTERNRETERANKAEKNMMVFRELLLDMWECECDRPGHVCASCCFLSVGEPKTILRLDQAMQRSASHD